MQIKLSVLKMMHLDMDILFQTNSLEDCSVHLMYLCKISLLIFYQTSLQEPHTILDSYHEPVGAVGAQDYVWIWCKHASTRISFGL